MVNVVIINSTGLAPEIEHVYELSDDKCMVIDMTYKGIGVKVVKSDDELKRLCKNAMKAQRISDFFDELMKQNIKGFHEDVDIEEEEGESDAESVYD